jgi:hypothetical protein
LIIGEFEKAESVLNICLKILLIASEVIYSISKIMIIDKINILSENKTDLII